MLSELPVQIINVFLYTIIVYFAVNLNGNTKNEFFCFFGICVITHLVGCAYGNLIGTFSKYVIVAVCVAPTIAAPIVIYGGFFTNLNSFSEAFAWIKYFSPFFYSFEALCLNEFEGLDLDSDLSISPLKFYDLSGHVWTRVGSLILLEIGLVFTTLIMLKLAVL